MNWSLRSSSEQMSYSIELSPVSSVVMRSGSITKVVALSTSTGIGVISDCLEHELSEIAMQKNMERCFIDKIESKQALHSVALVICLFMRLGHFSGMQAQRTPQHA